VTHDIYKVNNLNKIAFQCEPITLTHFSDARNIDDQKLWGMNMVVTFLDDEDEKADDRYNEQVKISIVQWNALKKIRPKQGELKLMFRELDYKIREYLEMQSMTRSFPEYYEAIKDDFTEYIKRLHIEVKLSVDTFKFDELDDLHAFIDQTWDDERKKYDDEHEPSGGGLKPIPPAPPSNTR